MYIEQVFPAVVGAIEALPVRLKTDALSAGLDEDQARRLIAVVPPRLMSAKCFEDRLTGLWRYEFGEPFRLSASNQLLWGTHMWIPIWQLRRALAALLAFVVDSKRAAYAARLDDPQKHMDTLSEMIPVLRLPKSTNVEFEVGGLGQGNRTIDWRIQQPGKKDVLLDVKYRAIDLIRQMDRLPEDAPVPAPDHDPALLLRSVEGKFLTTDPDVRLQGAWIVTNLQQEGSELVHAFGGLDPAKVHFVILAGWEDDAHVLARRAEDRATVHTLFRLRESNRFTFERVS